MNKQIEHVSRVITDSVDFTWKIENFTSLQKKTGEFVQSPVVKCSDSRFCLRLYPNGKEKANNVDVILEKVDFPLLLPFGEYKVGFKDCGGQKRFSFPIISKKYTSNESSFKSSPPSILECANTLATTNTPQGFAFGPVQKGSFVAAEPSRPIFSSVSGTSNFGTTAGDNSHKSVIPSSEKNNVSLYRPPGLSASEKTSSSTSLETDKGISLSRDSLFDLMEDLFPDNALTVVCEMKVPRLVHVSESTVDNDVSSSTGAECLLKSFKDAFKDPRFPDVTLKVGNIEFPAHKIILANRSKVFDSMFESGMKESQENVVNLVEMKPSIAKEMLRYIYTGEIHQMSMDKAMDLYAVADRYDMPELKKWCKDFLLQHISPAFVCDVAVLADLHSDEELDKACKRTIKNNLKTVLTSEKWISLSKENPTVYFKILQVSLLDDDL